jgi:hypothetical protein
VRLHHGPGSGGDKGERGERVAQLRRFGAREREAFRRRGTEPSASFRPAGRIRLKVGLPLLLRDFCPVVDATKREHEKRAELAIHLSENVHIFPAPTRRRGPRMTSRNVHGFDDCAH